MLLLAPLRAPLRAPLGHRSVRACAPPADLPLDAIIIEEDDKDVWLEEQLEFNGLRADPRTPRALQMPIGSFELPNGRYGHAFQGGGVSHPCSPVHFGRPNTAGISETKSDKIRYMYIFFCTLYVGY